MISRMQCWGNNRLYKDQQWYQNPSFFTVLCNSAPSKTFSNTFPPFSSAISGFWSVWEGGDLSIRCVGIFEPKYIEKYERFYDRIKTGGGCWGKGSSGGLSSQINLLCATCLTCRSPLSTGPTWLQAFAVEALRRLDADSAERRSPNREEKAAQKVTFIGCWTRSSCLNTCAC